MRCTARRDSPPRPARPSASTTHAAARVPRRSPGPDAGRAAARSRTRRPDTAHQVPDQRSCRGAPDIRCSGRGAGLAAWSPGHNPESRQEGDHATTEAEGKPDHRVDQGLTEAEVPALRQQAMGGHRPPPPGNTNGPGAKVLDRAVDRVLLLVSVNNDLAAVKFGHTSRCIRINTSCPACSSWAGEGGLTACSCQSGDGGQRPGAEVEKDELSALVSTLRPRAPHHQQRTKSTWAAAMASGSPRFQARTLARSPSWVSGQRLTAATPRGSPGGRRTARQVARWRSLPRVPYRTMLPSPRIGNSTPVAATDASRASLPTGQALGTHIARSAGERAVRLDLRRESPSVGVMRLRAPPLQSAPQDDRFRTRRRSAHIS